MHPDYLNDLSRWAYHNPTLAVSMTANIVLALVAIVEVFIKRRLKWAIGALIEGVGEEKFQQLVASVLQGKDDQIKSLHELIEQRSREVGEAQSNHRTARVERRKFNKAVKVLV